MNHFHLLYIDPGTGSLIAQAVLAGIIAGWVFFKNGIKKIFVRSNPPEKEQSEDEMKH